MTLNPVVSVVMPIYNHSIKQLSDAIRSILNQTFQNLELIIVDGSFDDENFKFISSIKDERIRYFREKRYIKCLNYGISQCKGKYIARMDSDDVSMPNRIEEQVKFLENNSDVSLCSCLVKIWSENIESFNSKHEYDITLLNFLNHHEFEHTAMMFRKNINLVYDDIKPLEDCLLFRKLLLDGHKFAIIDKVLLKNYRSKNSLMAKYPKFISVQNCKINIYALSKYYNYKLSFVDEIFKKRYFSKSEIIDFLEFVYSLKPKLEQHDLDIVKISTDYFYYILSRNKNNLFLIAEPLSYRTFFKFDLKKSLKFFIRKVFSITNEYKYGRRVKENKRKVITILGFKYKFIVKNN